MNLAIASAFRNSSSRNHLTRWLTQVAALQTRLNMDGHRLRAIAVEGDSTDDTRAQLLAGAARHSIALTLLTCDLGTPHFPSTEDPVRLSGLSRVLNTAMEATWPDDDAVLYVESDLIWYAGTILALVSVMACNEHIDILAPLVFAGPNFYDVWGFRKDGERFSPFPPYHACLVDAFCTPVDSVGSCLLMRGQVANHVRVTNDQALVGWCASAREKGYTIYVNPALRVDHPV